MLGFLRWSFAGCYKQVQFWTLSLVLLAVVAQLAGCPDPIPWYMTVVGITVSLLDLAVMLIKMQYHAYKFEQERVARELSRK